jgi:pimeloyl-ACP methyl ester carboxylesterase
MVENLSEGHRVLALDARGFGLSTRADGDYSLAALADDVALAMHAVGIEHAVIVGHSWGSAVALVFALRHPDRADKLILVDGLAYDSQVPWAMRAARTPGLGEFIVGTFFTAQFDAQLERAFYDPSILTFEQVASARSKMKTPGSRAAALAVSRGIDLRPWQARYGEIDVPVLVVWGKQDRILSPWWADRLATDLGRARVETIDHCGHFPMLEAPERLASLLEEFMQ